MTPFKQTAMELYTELAYRTRDDGSKYYCLPDGDETWRKRAVYAAHEGGERMPNDYTYEAIAEAAEAFSECDDYDNAIERLNEIEADVYNSDLSEWLNSHSGNIWYLDEYVEKYGTTNVLSGAQWLWKQEIAGIILDAITNEAETQEGDQS